MTESAAVESLKEATMDKSHNFQQDQARMDVDENDSNIGSVKRKVSRGITNELQNTTKSSMVLQIHLSFFFSLVD